MSKRNQYSFSKRQREIRKKKKAEEKRARKLAKKMGEDGLLEEGAELAPEEGDEEPGDGLRELPTS